MADVPWFSRKNSRVYEEIRGFTSTKLKSFEYGKTAALLDVNQELGFVEIVDKHAKKERLHGLTVGEYVLLLILGRCDEPLSKNQMADWFKKSCMILLWNFRHKLSSQNFKNHMDRLDEVRTSVEDDVFEVLIGKGLFPSILMLDTTNFYTYIEHGEELPKKGKSKHHRNDKNLVGLGLVTSEENIPFLHTTYEANTHDSKQFPKIFDDLVSRLTTLHVNIKDIVLVFDKGNNSKPNITGVVNDMHVVGSVSPKQVKDLMDVPLSRYTELYTNEKGHLISGYRTRKELFGLEFSLVITYNEHSYRKQVATYEKSKQKIFSNLRDLNRRLKSPKGKKRDRSSVEREISDIIRKDMRSVIKYWIKKEEEDGFRVVYRTDKDAEKQRYARFGKTAVFTDMHNWHSRKIAKTYNSKYLVEDDFKWLQTP